MDLMHSLGRTLIVIGVILAISGLVIYFGDKLGLGKLPGDIIVKKGTFTLYFPIVTIILVGIIVSVICRLFKR